MVFRIKVIHILTHSLSYIFHDQEYADSLPYEGGWHARVAKEILSRTQRYEVECWGMEKKLKKPLSFQRDGILFRIFASKNIKYFGEISVGLLRALHSQCDKEDTLVHVHTLYSYTTFFIPLMIPNVPIIVQHHGDKSLIHQVKSGGLSGVKKGVFLLLYIIRMEWLFERISFSRCDRIFTLNDEMDAYLKRLVPEGKVVRSTMGIDFGVFRGVDRRVAKESIGLDGSKKYILYVGNFVRIKGLDYLLEAFAGLSTDMRETILLLVGDGYYKENLMKKVADLDIAGKVEFVGWTEGKLLPLYYSAADLCVLPSLSEGLGIVAVEALACGARFVGTKVGGVPEVIKAFKAGILTRPASAPALMDGMIRALDESDFEVDRDAGKKRFDWGAIVASTINEYEVLQAQYFERNHANKDQ